VKTLATLSLIGALTASRDQAAAAVVFVDIPPPQETVVGGTLENAEKIYDFNGDGIDDLRFYWGITPPARGSRVEVLNGAVFAGSFYGGPVPFQNGAIIGAEPFYPPDPNFPRENPIDSLWFTSGDFQLAKVSEFGNSGYWNMGGGIMAFYFLEQGEPHYGWISMAGSLGGTVMSHFQYAFESSPNTPIEIALDIPETSTGLFLSLTAACLFHRGRRGRTMCRRQS
jgi:hypothetical protein